MRKIWIGITVLLVLLALYFEGIEEDKTELRKEDISSKTEVSKSRDKIVKENSFYELVFERKENPLTVHVEDDKNITRDHLVRLAVHAEPVPKGEWCNFWWREEGKLLGIGETLESTFKRGTHLITVTARDTLGHECNARMKVTAWEYSKKEYLHYSDATGEFTYREVKTYDHNERLVLEKGKNYRISYFYNIEGKLIEEQYESSLDMNLNYTRIYEYDEHGNKISSEEMDANNKTRWYESLSYTEEGYIDSFSMGTDINDAYSPNQYAGGGGAYEEAEVIYNEEENSEEEESKVVLDEDGNIVHEEINFGASSILLDYQYNEKNQTIEKRVSRRGEEYNVSRTTKYSYHEDGEVSGIEFIGSYDNNVTCHYSSSVSYTKNSLLQHRQTKVLEGDCKDMVENIYEEYKYNEEGEIVESKIKTYMKDTDRGSEIFTTLKTNNYYSNSLED